MMDEIIIVGDFVSKAEAKAQRDRVARIFHDDFIPVAGCIMTVSELYYRPDGYDWVYAIAIGEKA